MEHWWLQGVHSSWCGQGSTCNEILPEGVAQSCSGTLLGGGAQSCSETSRAWGSILHVGNLTIGMVFLQITRGGAQSCTKGVDSTLHVGVQPRDGN